MANYLYHLRITHGWLPGFGRLSLSGASRLVTDCRYVMLATLRLCTLLLS